MKSSFIISTGIAASMLVSYPALAQSVNTGTAPAITTAHGYQIASDDVLNINVVNFPTMAVQAVVTPDGYISVPLLGQVPVAGQTIESVTSTLTRSWSKYIVRPAVSVSMAKKHTESIVFSGYVTHPGPIDFHSGMHLMEALASSGGSLDTGDLSKLTVTHADGTKTVINSTNPERLRGTESDIALQVGDVVYIPEQRAEFSVVGEVMRPGSFNYKQDMTVLDAMTAVQGPTESADLAQARITRNGQDSPIDLDALLKHGDMSRNVKLTAGDRIVVPESHSRTYIYGAVGQPGYYAFKPGDRLLDALKTASGPARDANISNIHIVHVDSAKNVSGVQIVDLKDYLERGKLAGNALLQPGDAIYIPELKQHLSIANIFGLLSGLNAINNGARILNNGVGH